MCVLLGRWVVRSFLLRAESDNAECPVTVVVVTGSEKELISVAVGAPALAELNGPDIVNLNRYSTRVAERAEEGAGVRIKGVDASAGSIIGDEKCVAHGPKVGWCQRDTPRRMKRTLQFKVRQ